MCASVLQHVYIPSPHVRTSERTAHEVEDKNTHAFELQAQTDRHSLTYINQYTTQKLHLANWHRTQVNVIKNVIQSEM